MDLSRGRFDVVTGVGLDLSGVAKLTNVLVGQGGSGVVMRSGGSLDLRQATIASGTGIGVNNAAGGVVGIANSIVYSNVAGDLTGVPCSAVSWSDTVNPSCAGQNGNLSAPPQFGAGFHLAAGSPCLDSGPSPSGYTGQPATDLAGDLRLRDYDGDGLAKSDAGAYEETNSALVPGEVTNVRWTGKTAIAWDAVAGATQYHSYRGPLDNRSYGTFGTCADGVVPVSGTTATESAVPSAGQGYFYVFTAENGSASEGTMGFATGAERSNFNPCP